jgi:hypothetical protein
VKQVEAFSDSLPVVKQHSKVFKCFNGSLNSHLDISLKVISSFDRFSIHNITRHKNVRANSLAEQAFIYVTCEGRFAVVERPMLQSIDVYILHKSNSPVS